MNDKKQILIVDDVISNIRILNNFLSEEYEIRVATSGREALDTISAKLPDLVLLDIMMPGMNGYEVCAALKKDRQTEDIPVIFLTALEEMEDEENGLQLGAVDYITKPIRPSIVKARIQNHLLLKNQKDQLRKSISLMEHEAEILSHKAELGLQAGGFAHDMANLLTTVSFIQFVPEQLPDDLAVKKSIKEDIRNAMTSLHLCHQVCKGFTSYLQNIGDEAAVAEPASLLRPLDIYARRFKGRVDIRIAPGLPGLKCKGYQMKRVLVNLFVNAVQAVENVSSPIISIRVWAEKKHMFFSVQDNGPGIAESVLPHIFDERFTTKSEGTGLGLHLVRQIVDAHGGTIQVASKPDGGTRFELSFLINHDVV